MASRRLSISFLVLSTRQYHWLVTSTYIISFPQGETQQPTPNSTPHCSFKSSNPLTTTKNLSVFTKSNVEYGDEKRNINGERRSFLVLLKWRFKRKGKTSRSDLNICRTSERANLAPPPSLFRESGLWNLTRVLRSFPRLTTTHWRPHKDTVWETPSLWKIPNFIDIQLVPCYT